jgi:ferric-dicitrate binding protein FerR (iron transport regulator)
MTDRIDENPPMSIRSRRRSGCCAGSAGDVSIAERFEYLQWLKTRRCTSPRCCACAAVLVARERELKLYITNEDTFSNVVALAPRSVKRRTCAVQVARDCGNANRAGLCGDDCACAVLGFARRSAGSITRCRRKRAKWRSVPLSDGSSITAAPYTSLHHDIGDDERRVSLDHGKAMFRVAKDPSRPFLVEAGGVVVRATGTQFGVESSGEDVIVTMTEGTVIVTPAADNEASFTVSLKADDQLTVSGFGSPRVAGSDAERVTHWAERTRAVGGRRYDRRRSCAIQRLQRNQDRRR